MTNPNFFHLERDNNPKRKEAFTADFIGKLFPIMGRNLNKGCEYLEKILLESLKIQAVEENVLIIGLTESGIIPSILMQKVAQENGITTTLLSSTRRPSPSGIVFIEKHSHAPNHCIPVPQQKITELWIVEDEMTTGNTVFEVLSQFCSQLEIKKVRIFALADFRNTKQKMEALKIQQSLNVECVYQSFLHFDDVCDIAPGKPLSTTTNTERNDYHCTGNQQSSSFLDIWHMPQYRSAINQQPNNEQEANNWHMPDNFSDTTVLVIGETVDIATHLALANPDFSFQHITLSPWKIDNASIVSRLNFDNKYFLYNYKTLSKTVCILNDPIDEEISRVVKEKLEENDFTVKTFPLKKLMCCN